MYRKALLIALVIAAVFLVIAETGRMLVRRDAPSLYLSAAQKNDTGLFGILLFCGAPINTRDSTGATALLLAARQGDRDAMRFLLKHGADMRIADSMGNAPGLAFLDSWNWGKTDDKERFLLELLSEGQPLVGARRETASMNGGPAETIVITPLSRAIDLKCSKLAIALLDSGVDPNKGACYFNETPLTRAAQTEMYDVARKLVEKGADLNVPWANLKQTALHLMIASDTPEDLKLARFLVEKGANTNLKDIYGNTPLVILVERSAMNHENSPTRKQTLQLLQALLAAGADPNILYGVDTSVLAFTPLQQALMQRDFTMARLLLKGGADPNQRDRKGARLIEGMRNLPEEFAVLLKPAPR